MISSDKKNNSEHFLRKWYNARIAKKEEVLYKEDKEATTSTQVSPIKFTESNIKEIKNLHNFKEFLKENCKDFDFIEVISPDEYSNEFQDREEYLIKNVLIANNKKIKEYSKKQPVFIVIPKNNNTKLNNLWYKDLENKLQEFEYKNRLELLHCKFKSIHNVYILFKSKSRKTEDSFVKFFKQ